MRQIELEMHEGDEPVTVALVRREDGSVVRARAGQGSVRTLELLLGEDLGGDTLACDEVLEAIRSVECGVSGVVYLAWDLTELEIRPGTSKVRLSLPDGVFDWIDVSTRELKGAVMRLCAFAEGGG